jgi:4-oxalocrotonate tautomerase
MPLITVAISQGRTPEQIRAMIHEVHAAVYRTVGAQPDHIRIIVQEIPRDHWATGDVTLTEMDQQKGQGH